MFYTYYKKVGRNKIFVRYKKDGKTTKSRYVDFYKPKLYYADNDPSNEWQSIYGQSLKQIEFDDMQSASDYIKTYKHVDDMDIHGNSNFANQFMIELFEGQQPEHNPDDIRVGFVDIEVDAEVFPEPSIAKWPINGYTFWDSFSKKFYVCALTNENGDTWSQEKSEEPEIKGLEIEYKQFDNEKELVAFLLQHIYDFDYDIVSGWNSEGFDIPYIINRGRILLGKKFVNQCLSITGRIAEREVVDEWKNVFIKYGLEGRSHLDYMALYKKHTFEPRESYALDFIASEELGSKKISYDEAGSLHELYRTNFQKFVDYNIQDVNLMVRLEEKLGLFRLTYALAYYTLSNYEDTLGTVKVWEQLIAKFLYSKNVAPLASRLNGVNREFEGAYVKIPNPGFYEWLLTVDLDSLYPHCEMQYNIGPETHVPYEELPRELQEIKEKYTLKDLIDKKADLSVLKNYNYSMAANFEFYDNTNMSFFSEIKRDLYKTRKVYKKQMLEMEQKKVDAKDKAEARKYEDLESFYNNMQMGLKILLNGGYGALGQSSFLYYMVENAEAITLSGQLINKWTCNRVNTYLQKLFETDENLWVYSDTDSGYFTVKHFVNMLDKKLTLDETVNKIDKFSKEIVEPHIHSLCDEMADYMNAYEQKMNWSRELIAQSGIWVAKKRYAMMVNDSEGTRYKTPKMKVKGLESKKSSTPAWSRKFLNECYKYCLDKDKDTLYSRLDQMRGEFDKMGINDIAIPRGVNGIQKWTGDDGLPIKRTPFNVKAAIAHNNIVKSKNLNTPLITDGSKIKMIHLKNPNPFRVDIVAFDGFLPKEFGVEKYVDYNSMYDKAFMSPLEIFLGAIGWESEDTNTLF